jgi:peptide subunit release factor 1 (eRF1)
VALNKSIHALDGLPLELERGLALFCGEFVSDSGKCFTRALMFEPAKPLFTKLLFLDNRFHLGSFEEQDVEPDTTHSSTQKKKSSKEYKKNYKPKH